jgi:hypothetical protein
MPSLFEGCVRVTDSCHGLILLLMQHFFTFWIYPTIALSADWKGLLTRLILSWRGACVLSQLNFRLSPPELFDMNPHLNMVCGLGHPC